MSVYKKDTEIKRFPRAIIVTREKDRDGHINVTAGDMATFADDIFYGSFIFASAVSYALNNNKDPIASYDREKRLGFPTHWLTHLPTTISSAKQPVVTELAINLEDTYRFEGKIFRIVKTPNRNLNLIEVKD